MTWIKRLNNYFIEQQSQNLHVVKYAIAFSVGFLVTQLLHDRYSVWVLITIAVVMANQPLVSQLLEKSFFRILGTVIGAVLGVVTFYLPDNTISLFIATVVVSLIITRLFAFRLDESSQVSTLGMVTFSLVAFLGHRSVHFAFMRLLDTLLGIVIAYFISRFIFPVTSKRAFLMSFKKTIKNLNEFANQVFINGADRLNDVQLNEVETELVGGITKMRTLIRAGHLDSKDVKVNKAEYNAVILYSRAIYNYLLFIDVALIEISEANPELAAFAREELKPVILTLSDVLQALSACQRFIIPEFNVKALEQNIYQDYPSQYYTIVFALRRIPYCLQKIQETELV
jgi:uncharacterized membrane protein YgaE (UPF0421/DUF939 family)